jgi:hypothetical protein
MSLTWLHVKDHAGMLVSIRKHTRRIKLSPQIRRPQDLQDFCIARIASQAVCALKLLVYAALSYSERGLKIQGRIPLTPFEL